MSGTCVACYTYTTATCRRIADLRNKQWASFLAELQANNCLH
ncbi:hypothetical protein [Novosphingobium acidiphilum]|jgi:hypothetical protein|nr:hypothetical protein [Novosphingobium acidiphilum]